MCAARPTAATGTSAQRAATSSCAIRKGYLAEDSISRLARPVNFTVYNPLTGAVVMGPVTKYPSDPAFKLDQGPEAYIIKGVLGASDLTPPSPPSSFTSVNNGTVNSLLGPTPRIPISPAR